MAAQKNKPNSDTTKRLFNSIFLGRLLTIKTLLQKNVDIDACDSSGRTPLLLACSEDQKQIANLLIKTGANVNGKCKGDKYTVLHYASLYGWENLVLALVNKVTDLNARNNKGDTAMHLAARSGHLKVVRCLVKEGADVNRKNHLGFTPLMYAAQGSHKSIFNLLLKSGANVGSEKLVLYYASQNSWKTVVKLFLKRLPDLKKRFVMGETALDATSSRGHLEVLKFLLEEGAAINRKEEMICQAALHCASRMGHLEVVEWLLKKEPDMMIVLDINASDYLDLTALHLACDIQHLEIVKCLVEKGADIKAKDSKGGTALHRASTNGHLEVVKCLLEEGADINTMDLSDETPLFKALTKGHLEVVKLLLENGADINAKNSKNFTPLLSAASLMFKNEADLLIHSGASVDLFDYQKQVLLYYASKNGWVEMVQVLIKRGCDVNALNQLGDTALNIACYFRHLDVAQALLQAGASWDVKAVDGSLFGYPIRCGRPEFFRLFIENGAYFKPVHYIEMLKISSVPEVLQDTKLCCQAIINKFNNHDLPELYELPASGSFPPIEKMKITSGKEAAQAIERAVEFDILANGHCNFIKVRPIVLSVFAVRSVLEYRKKKESQLKKQLKRQAAADSVNINQRSKKSMRLN